MYFVSIDAGAQVANYFTRMWTRCGHCKLFGTGCIWVELPVQRRLFSIFMSSVRVVDGLSMRYPGFGASQLGIRAKVNDYLGSSVGVSISLVLISASQLGIRA